MAEFRQSAPLAAPAGIQFSEAEKTAPSYTGNAILAVILLPMAAGMAGGILTLMLAVAIGFDAPWHLAAFGFAVTGGIALYIVLTHIMDLSQERQVIIGAPATTPAPAETVSRIQVEINEPRQGTSHWRMVDIEGITPAQFAELARGLCLGRPFAEDEWCGHGRLFSKPQFRMMRAELLERGVVAPRNPAHPAQGFALTYAGQRVMQRIAEAAWVPATVVRNRAQAGTPAQITAGTEPQEGREAELAEEEV